MEDSILILRNPLRMLTKTPVFKYWICQERRSNPEANIAGLFDKYMRRNDVSVRKSTTEPTEIIRARTHLQLAGTVVYSMPPFIPFEREVIEKFQEHIARCRNIVSAYDSLDSEKQKIASDEFRNAAKYKFKMMPLVFGLTILVWSIKAIAIFLSWLIVLGFIAILSSISSFLGSDEMHWSKGGLIFYCGLITIFIGSIVFGLVEPIESLFHRLVEYRDTLRNFELEELQISKQRKSKPTLSGQPFFSDVVEQFWVKYPDLRKRASDQNVSIVGFQHTKGLSTRGNNMGRSIPTAIRIIRRLVSNGLPPAKPNQYLVVHVHHSLAKILQSELVQVAGYPILGYLGHLEGGVHFYACDGTVIYSEQWEQARSYVAGWLDGLQSPME